MQYVVYSFEAKSIQTYVLASSKLKDRIGASEQIESLCTYEQSSLLDSVLDKLGLQDKLEFSRRAGGAFVAIFPEDPLSEQNAKNLQTLWVFSVQKLMPSLRFSHGIGVASSTKEAVKVAFEKQRLSMQQQFPLLPMAGSLAEFSPRSGRVAIESRKGSETVGLLDESTKLKRQLSSGKLLISKLGDYTDWPTVMPEDDVEDTDQDKVFYFPSEDRTIAVVHADINNLGSISLELFKAFHNESYVADAKAFTSAVETAVREAVKQAIKTIAEQTMPARPLVLAGDDITFIVRGDKALSFTQELLERLEETTKEALKPIKEKYGVAPEYLTACAGLAYIKSSQPFYQAYRLADSLCEMAKIKSKTRQKDNGLDIVPSSLAFHRITTSMIEEYQDVINKELTTDSGLVLSQQPYFLGQGHQNKPRLNDLIDLQSLLNKVGHSRVRPLLSMLYESQAKTDKAFNRWGDVLDKTKQKSTRRDITETLLKLTESEHLEVDNIQLSSLWETNKQTPLADAIALTRVMPNEG